jgi:hypothetical protein
MADNRAIYTYIVSQHSYDTGTSTLSVQGLFIPATIHPFSIKADTAKGSGPDAQVIRYLRHFCYPCVYSRSCRHDAPTPGKPFQAMV